MSALVRAAVVRLLGTEMFAEYALKLFGALYAVEEAARELDADQRKRLRQLRSKRITDTLHEWLALHRQRATDGTAMARAIDYASAGGRRSCASLTMVIFRSTTTISKTGSARSHSEDQTGCLRDRYAVASVRPPR
jgi:hypothetical protein